MSERNYNKVIVRMPYPFEFFADGRNRYADKTDFFLGGLLCASVPNSYLVFYPEGWKEELRVPKTEIYSGVPNEHNLNPEDAEWYKQHMANQKEVMDGVKEEMERRKNLKFSLIQSNEEGFYECSELLNFCDRILGSDATYSMVIEVKYHAEVYSYRFDKPVQEGILYVFAPIPLGKFKEGSFSKES